MARFKTNVIAKLLIMFCSQLVAFSLYASDLVDVNWLKGNKQALLIVDLRSAAIFETGHIPSAINIPYGDFTRIKNGVNGFVETPGTFKSLMEQHGIKNRDSVLLYSDWSFLDSMRVYWIMDFYGHKNIKVLDGGIQAWGNAGGEFSIDEIVTEKSHYVIEINTDIITTKFRTFMASNNPKYVIVDGRDKSQYQGKKSLTTRKGHIPNAVNIPWVDLVKNREEGDSYDHLKMPSTLEDMTVLKEKLSLIPADKKIILYCNGGQESSVLYFALKELGRKASVYDGSWFEWSADDAMPITKIANN